MPVYHNTYYNNSKQDIAECMTPDFVLNGNLAVPWEHHPQTSFLILSSKKQLAEALQLRVSMLQLSLNFTTKKCMQCLKLTTYDLDKYYLVLKKLCSFCIRSIYLREIR